MQKNIPAYSTAPNCVVNSQTKSPKLYWLPDMFCPLGGCDFNICPHALCAPWAWTQKHYRRNTVFKQ
eukprot:1471490-Amphidinium_carterae.1